MGGHEKDSLTPNGHFVVTGFGVIIYCPELRSAIVSQALLNAEPSGYIEKLTEPYQHVTKIRRAIHGATAHGSTHLLDRLSVSCSNFRFCIVKTRHNHVRSNFGTPLN